MSILKPDLIWISGKCYRVNPGSKSALRTEKRLKKIDLKELKMENKSSSTEPTQKPKKNPYPTHFTCVPLVTPEIQASVLEFREKVMLLNSPGILSKHFIDPRQLHVTFTIMNLNENEDREKACYVLDEITEQVVKPQLEKFKNIPVQLNGIGTFSGRGLKKCGVIFANVESPTLQELADEILHFYVKSGLSSYEFGRTNVKMHMTLMKTGSRNTFDATQIFEHFSKTSFGTALVNEIHLSKMKSSDENGFYVAVKVVKFNEL